MEDRMFASAALDSRPTRRAERDIARRRSWKLTVWIIVAAIAIVVIAGLVYQATGGRWFTVQTPSMGQTAPIGTLVLDSPASYSSLRVGQIISFHPPTAPSETYTHRIVGITDVGISTKGDINGAADPWLLHRGDIIGRATAILPGIGWLVKGVPYLLIGGIIVWLVTTPLRSPTSRAAWRITGVAFVIAITAYLLRPFVGVLLLATTTTRHGASAILVSSGLLPIRVTALHGSSVHLVSGEVGQVTIPELTKTGHYALSSALDLPLLGWILFVFLCLTPLLWVLFVGLPPDPDRELRR
jgi:signal peptidase I